MTTRPAPETGTPRATSLPGASPSSIRLLKRIALVSGVYDALIGVAMLVGRDLLVVLFNAPAPQPPIHADLNGLFALAIALGYTMPYRDPVHYRPYLWLMGPLLKGVGALLFIGDVVLRGSPASYLAFAACDGTLALVTLWALRRK